MPRFTDGTFHDDINELLDNLIDGPGYLKDQNVPLKEIFTESFMKKYTNVSTFEEFLSLGGLTIESSDDLDAVPVSELDTLTLEHTKFGTWAEMHSKAAQMYLDQH
jgi:hypothetical protein